MAVSTPPHPTPARIQERLDALPRHRTATAQALRHALERDPTPRGLLVALRTIAEARGGLPLLARAAGVSYLTLQRALAPAGAPRLATVMAVLRALGLQLTVEPASLLPIRRPPTPTPDAPRHWLWEVERFLGPPVERRGLGDDPFAAENPVSAQAVRARVNTTAIRQARHDRAWQRRPDSIDRLLVDLLRADPASAVDHLRAGQKHNPTAQGLLDPLYRVVWAHGGAGAVARRAGLHRRTVERAVAPGGNPRLLTLLALARVLGLRLTFDRAPTVHLPYPEPAEGPRHQEHQEGRSI